MDNPFSISPPPAPPAADRIRAAALECFAAEGNSATSLREVAEAAGVSIGLVQHHFGTKAGLVAAVDDHVIRVVADAVASTPLPPPPADSLAELGHRVTAIMTANPEIVDYLARAFVDRDEIGTVIFDGLVTISSAQWNQFADHDLLRADIDRTWAVLNALSLIIGTIILRAQIERHLCAPLTSPTQLRRWDDAVAMLLRAGLFRQTRNRAREHPRHR
jgi:AcrR family transcriptional regulator